ncbi:indolepyruvate oxidoreductase subunit beta [Wukongibacter sp. M2B1]|uniref:indolepyruvate oxidoreductase subunit beta n=1 Tax=Wukongibacter sp. M2B1 TaxID=3088895 RepID=UPI003D7A60A7
MVVDPLNLIICGVGGQGVVLASDIISSTFLEAGYDVKTTDIIGLGQRGGSVITHVRVGDKIVSPLIKKGEADIILSFEKYEALRWSRYLKNEGDLIMNDQSITPTSVTEKLEEDIDLDGLIDRLDYNKMLIDISEVLRMNDISTKCINIVMLGILSLKTHIEEILWEDIIGENVSSDFAEDNLRAFRIGRKLAVAVSDNN